jgi:serine/threonine-protein phosphatase 2B regulatory subunit
MGAAASLSGAHYAHASIDVFRPTFEKLQFTRGEVNQMYKVFRQVDTDGSGDVSILEFLMAFELERTPFTVRAFSVFDDDRSGELDFQEFVVSLWNYCTSGNLILMFFAFDLYDADDSGLIDANEMNQILQDIYGSNLATSSSAKLIQKKLHNLPDEITKNTFANFVRRHPAMMFPVFRLQGDMQERILGRKWWKKLTVRRNAVDEFQSLDLSTILKSVANDGSGGAGVPRLAEEATRTGGRRSKAGRWHDAAPLDAHALKENARGRVHHRGRGSRQMLTRENSNVADAARAAFEVEEKEHRKKKKKKHRRHHTKIADE